MTARSFPPKAISVRPSGIQRLRPEFETVAGFMLDSLGSVPKGGEAVTVGEYRLTVVDVEKNRISKVKIEKLPAAAPAKA